MHPNVHVRVRKQKCSPIFFTDVNEINEKCFNPENELPFHMTRNRINRIDFNHFNIMRRKTYANISLVYCVRGSVSQAIKVVVGDYCIYKNLLKHRKSHINRKVQ